MSRESNDADAAAPTQAEQPAQQSDLHAETYPEGFDSSCGLPAWAMREANRTAASLTGRRAWDVPCIAAALVATAPQQPAQQAVRMLTSDELYAALPTPRTPGEYIGTQNVAFTWDAWQAYVGAVERKFCEVNGIALPPAAKEQKR